MPSCVFVECNINKMFLRVLLASASDKIETQRAKAHSTLFKVISQRRHYPNFRHKLVSYPFITEALQAYYNNLINTTP